MRERRGGRESEREEKRGGERSRLSVSPHHVLFPTYLGDILTSTSHGFIFLSSITSKPNSSWQL